MKLIQGMIGPEDLHREMRIEMMCVPTYLDDDSGIVYVNVSGVRVVHSDGFGSITEWRFQGEGKPTLRMENQP